MSQLCKYAQNAYRSKNLLRLNMHPQRSIPKEDTKISHCGSRSPKCIKLGHFTLLFCRGRQRNVQSFKTHVHSYCSAHQTFCLVTFPLPSPSWFAKFCGGGGGGGEGWGGGGGGLPSKFVLENFMKIHLIIFMKFCFFFRKVAPQRAVVSRRIQ